ncbi:hypothetical protein LIER_18122 [Lithospermum erythrorhizon]|uniref:Helitron helicase-like domain-containing protein n=1 Tax=Lithospermum erythrorhizon TaxID=34254 RepID=A0AAV3QGY8_LITER
MFETRRRAQNRPDLLCRVFKEKLGILNDKSMSGQVFGEVASVVHVVEFQKHGLPHAHFLIILKPSYKYLSPEAYDRIVSVELLDKNNDPYLYSLVVKHMMHGPYGNLNPKNICMKNGKCKNHYAKEFAEYTTHGKGNYPIYRRRDDGKSAKIMKAQMLMKYLTFKMHVGLSPVEAMWRIFGFPLYGMYPAMLQLQVHLPNFQSIQFEDDVDLEEILQNERLRRTMLTKIFRINATDPEVKRLKLLFKDFPRYYV